MKRTHQDTLAVESCHQGVPGWERGPDTCVSSSLGVTITTRDGMWVSSSGLSARYLLDIIAMCESVLIVRGAGLCRAAPVRDVEAPWRTGVIVEALKSGWRVWWDDIGLSGELSLALSLDLREGVGRRIAYHAAALYIPLRKDDERCLADGTPTVFAEALATALREIP